MNEKDFIEKAVESIVEYHNVNKSDIFGKISKSNVYIVWQCKTLQNNKALLSTTTPDGMYYEFTWNGDRNEGYLDAYKKEANSVIK